MDNLTSKQRKEIAKSNVRYLHVSQYYNRVEQRDEKTGIVTEVLAAAFPRGKTFSIGRNAFKRMCRRNGLNRVQLERRAEQQQAA